MKNYDSLYNSINTKNCYSKTSYDDLVVGNSIDIQLEKNDSEVRADLTVSRVDTVRIWGIVKDCDGMPISNALIKLVKPINKNGIMEYEGACYTVTDCSGFYQMDVPCSDSDSKYKILVSKASVGYERIICCDNCNPCSPEPPCPPMPPSTPNQLVPTPTPSPCPPNQQNHINKYPSNMEKRSSGYTTETVHNQFYGEVMNKGNIFKKSE